MAERLKISVIGGGSVYTPELVAGFLSAPGELPVTEIALMDIDRDRLATVGGLVQRMARAAQADLTVTVTTDRGQALDGARFVIAQLRVGGNAQRVVDETIPVRFGVVGQETTGPGGFAKALRTVPVLLDIAAEMGRLCPEAWLVNFTNPSGLITEALLRHGRVRTIGLCNLPLTMTMDIARLLDAAPGELFLDYVGLNHLSWVRRVFRDGRDVTGEMMARAVAEARQSPRPGFDPALLEALGMLPCSYLRYYYHHGRVVAEQRTAGRTRGEEVLAIDADLLERYRDPELAVKPPQLAKRGGAWYSRAAVSVIGAIAGNKREIHIVSCRNQGAVPDLPPESVVEAPCVVGAAGPVPMVTGPLPGAIRGLVQAVKGYEELTIEAAVTGDRRTALAALLAHPLVPDYEAAQGLLDAILAANRPWLPRFFAPRAGRG
jgi:6-phospho-beta-glucosidase